jgi:hypothetical protein
MSEVTTTNNQDWFAIINDAALRWASVITHQPIDQVGGQVVIGPDGVRVGASNTMLLAGVAIVALLVFSSGKK